MNTSAIALASFGRVPGIVFMAAPTIDELRARQQELLAEAERLTNAAGDEGPGEEEITAIQASADEAERIGRQIAALESVDRLRASRGRQTVSDATATSSSTATAARVPATPRADAGRFGFRNLGDFAASVRNVTLGQPIDPRLQNAATTFGSEGVGADGGYAVPPDLRTDIMSKIFGEESLVSRTDRMPTASNTLTMPIDMTTPWQTTGGVQAYWTGEAATKTQSKIALEEVSVRTHTLAALVPVTEELLEDAPALDGYLRRKVPEKMDFKISNAIGWGNGVGMPLGYMNSPCLVTVAAEGGQTSGTINATNVVKMLARMPVSSRPTAAWIIHPDAEPQLPLMTLGQQPVYLPPGGLSSAPFGNLLGRPVIPHQIAKSLGTLGDIMLVDLSQYLSLLKSGAGRDQNGLRTDVSIHLWFDQDIVAYRFTIRMGGQPWWSAATAMLNGSNTMSPFITLAAR
jgi:HK97 family phage major capsid protein